MQCRSYVTIQYERIHYKTDIQNWKVKEIILHKLGEREVMESSLLYPKLSLTDCSEKNKKAFTHCEYTSPFCHSLRFQPIQALFAWCRMRFYSILWETSYDSTILYSV